MVSGDRHTPLGSAVTGGRQRRRSGQGRRTRPGGICSPSQHNRGRPRRRPGGRDRRAAGDPGDRHSGATSQILTGTRMCGSRWRARRRSAFDPGHHGAAPGHERHRIEPGDRGPPGQGAARVNGSRSAGGAPHGPRRHHPHRHPGRGYRARDAVLCRALRLADPGAAGFEDYPMAGPNQISGGGLAPQRRLTQPGRMSRSTRSTTPSRRQSSTAGAS